MRAPWCRTKTKVDYSTNQTGPAVITSPPPFTASDIELDSLDACEVRHGQQALCTSECCLLLFAMN